MTNAWPPSRFRCRIHNGEPVTWRGTGCAKCAEDEHHRTPPVVRDRITEFLSPSTNKEN